MESGTNQVMSKKKVNKKAYIVIAKTSGFRYGVFSPDKAGKLLATQYADKLNKKLNRVSHKNKKEYVVVSD